MLKSNVVPFPENLARPAFNRERLLEARLAKGLTQTKLAELVEVSVEMISNLESGQRQPGPETLVRLCEKLGYLPAYFTTTHHDGGVLESPVFFRCCSAKTKRQNLCLDVWRKRAGWLLTLTHYLDLPPVRLPEVNWSPTDSPHDLLNRAESLAQECRRTWGLGDGPIGNFTRLLESMGVCVIRLNLPEIEPDVDGFSCWQDGRPMIFLLATSSAARERLNLAHETLHLIAHRQVPADALLDKKALKTIEQQAFAFAGALLLPRKTYGREVYSLNIPHFVQLKQRWGVAIAAQGKRCLDLELMDDDRFLQFRKNLSWNRYIKREPLDNVLPHEEPMMMRQAMDMLKERGIVDAQQIAQLFSLPAETLSQLTNVEESNFVPADDVPAPSLRFKLRDEDAEQA